MSSLDPRSFLATSKSRNFAYLMDLCACALLLVPTAFAAYCFGTPSAGAFEFSLLFFAYHVYFLAFKEGVSPGKFIQNIAVVSSNGRPLHVWQAFARAGCLAFPWLLISTGDFQWLAGLASRDVLAALPTTGAALIAIDLALIEFVVDRRSLTDRIASTTVVSLPPPQPHRAPAVPMFSANDAEFGLPPKEPPRK